MCEVSSRPVSSYFRTPHKHLEKCIKISSSCSLQPPFYALTFQLCTKKEELHQLYVELKSMRNFSEQCAGSVLHRLIISLVELATSKTGEVSTHSLLITSQFYLRRRYFNFVLLNHKLFVFFCFFLFSYFQVALIFSLAGQ